MVDYGKFLKQNIYENLFKIIWLQKPIYFNNK